MQRTRIHELTDLILQARALWGGENVPYTSISMEVNNRDSVSISIMENINDGAEKIAHYYQTPHDYITNAITDPDFSKAESHIRRLLEDAK